VPLGRWVADAKKLLLRRKAYPESCHGLCPK
jgi:hypothetical protein